MQMLTLIWAFVRTVSEGSKAPHCPPKLPSTWDSCTVALVFGTDNAAYDRDHEMADADSR